MFNEVKPRTRFRKYIPIFEIPNQREYATMSLEKKEKDLTSL